MADNPRKSVDEALSPAMKDVFKILNRAATSDLGILIVGEFGTGKKWLARRIHQMSLRAGKIFLAFDCSTLSPETMEQEIFGLEQSHDSPEGFERGILEEASGGTLFLAGFSNLPSQLQEKVVRAVEQQKFHRMGGKKDIWFNARVILSSPTKPDVETPRGNVQQNFYYRLTPIVITLPRLQERREDILPLINRFITAANEQNRTSVIGINAEALKICLNYAWPGNVRELRNTIEYAVIMAQKNVIQPIHLPLQVRGGSSPVQEKIGVPKTLSVMEVEKLLIEHTLRQTSSRKEAARLLGISVKTLYNKLSRYNMTKQAVDDSGSKESTDTKNNSSLVEG